MDDKLNGIGLDSLEALSEDTPEETSEEIVPDAESKEISSGGLQVIKAKEEKVEKDYGNEIAAQLERAYSQQKEETDLLYEEQRKRVIRLGVLTGVCASALLVATHFSNCGELEPSQAIEITKNALQSFDGLWEQLSMYTPAMWASMILTASSLSLTIKENRKLKELGIKRDTLYNNRTVEYQSFVESEARNK